MPVRPDPLRYDDVWTRSPSRKMTTSPLPKSVTRETVGERTTSGRFSVSTRAGAERTCSVLTGQDAVGVGSARAPSDDRDDQPSMMRAGTVNGINAEKTTARRTRARPCGASRSAGTIQLCDFCSHHNQSQRCHTIFIWTSVDGSEAITSRIPQATDVGTAACYRPALPTRGAWTGRFQPSPREVAGCPDGRSPGRQREPRRPARRLPRSGHHRSRSR
jgi:hypothetical protein